jgi:hypothetical protein
MAQMAYKPVGEAVRVLVSEPVRLGSSWLITPSTTTKFTPYYEADLCFTADHPQRKAVGDAIRAVVAMFKVPPKHLPTQTGAEYAETMAAWAAAKSKDRKFDWALPFTILHCKAKIEQPPRLMVAQNGKWAENANRASFKPFFYGGVEVLADLSVIGYEAQGGVVQVYINDCRSLNRGEAFPGMASTAADRLSGDATASKHLGEVRAEDPSKGLDDEIPF